MRKFLLFIQDMLSAFHEKAHIHFDSKFTNPKKLREFTLQTFLLIIDVCICVCEVSNWKHKTQLTYTADRMLAIVRKPYCKPVFNVNKPILVFGQTSSSPILLLVLDLTTCGCKCVCVCGTCMCFWVKFVSRISATPAASPYGTELSLKAGSTH